MERVSKCYIEQLVKILSCIARKSLSYFDSFVTLSSFQLSSAHFENFIIILFIHFRRSHMVLCDFWNNNLSYEITADELLKDFC